MSGHRVCGVTQQDNSANLPRRGEILQQVGSSDYAIVNESQELFDERCCEAREYAPERFYSLGLGTSRFFMTTPVAMYPKPSRGK